MNDQKNIFEFWTSALLSSLPFWGVWNFISKYQKDIIDNYRNALFGNLRWDTLMSLVPSNLSQVINPTSFSLIQMTKEMKGTPSVEARILTDVAGYGSQLGTMMDVLEILGIKAYPDKESRRSLSDEDELKYLKFKELSGKIRTVKGQDI